MEYGPHVVRTASGVAGQDYCQDVVVTKFSKLLNLLPIMVAETVPTMVPWDFVTAICNAGFFVELIASGCLSLEAFKQARFYNYQEQVLELASLPEHPNITIFVPLLSLRASRLTSISSLSSRAVGKWVHPARIS